MDTNRGSFTGKIGFVLAAAGSAVGLGNIWRFPYLTAEYGGGIFLLVYIILAVTFGFSLMIAEIAIGRKTGMSAINAYRALDKRFGFVGYITAIIPAIILPYYSVIGGWVTKYFFGFITGEADAMADKNYFTGYIQNLWEPILWFALFMAITAVIVLFGVNKGIEKVSKVMMPVLVVLILFIAIYTIVAIEKSWDGVVYYLKPDFSKFSIKTVFAAMGQLFYSMSLAMGIMITFGSYTKKDISIEKSTRQIEIFDTIVAFLAGLMIIPAVVAFEGVEGVGKGAGLMFITLPQVFDKMPGGAFVGAVFFLMVFFAALTSSISLMETVVSVMQDKMKLSRKTSCIITFVFSLILGIVTCLGYSEWKHIDNLLGMKMKFLDLFDFVSNSVLMPIAAFFTCLCIGYFVKPKWAIEEVELNGKFKGKTLFVVMIKYIAPVFILLILITSILDAMGNAGIISFKF